MPFWGLASFGAAGGGLALFWSLFTKAFFASPFSSRFFIWRSLASLASFSCLPGVSRLVGVCAPLGPGRLISVFVLAPFTGTFRGTIFLAGIAFVVFTTRILLDLFVSSLLRLLRLGFRRGRLLELLAVFLLLLLDLLLLGRRDRRDDLDQLLGRFHLVGRRLAIITHGQPVGQRATRLQPQRREVERLCRTEFGAAGRPSSTFLETYGGSLP